MQENLLRMIGSENGIPNVSVWSIPREVIPQTTGFSIYKNLSKKFHHQENFVLSLTSLLLLS